MGRLREGVGWQFECYGEILPDSSLFTVNCVEASGDSQADLGVSPASATC